MLLKVMKTIPTGCFIDLSFSSRNSCVSVSTLDIKDYNRWNFEEEADLNTNSPFLVIFCRFDFVTATAAKEATESGTICSVQMKLVFVQVVVPIAIFQAQFGLFPFVENLLKFVNIKGKVNLLDLYLLISFKKMPSELWLVTHCSWYLFNHKRSTHFQANILKFNFDRESAHD